jgi:capsular polysaccharide export protein
MSEVARAIFVVPPFPGARPCDVAPQTRRQTTASPAVTPDALISALRRHRVGGPFWSEEDVWNSAAHNQPVAAEGDDARLLLAAIAGRTLRPASAGQFSHLADHELGSAALEAALLPLVDRLLINEASYADPFDGKPIEPVALIEILGGWRTLIDANRPIAAAFGFAHWKRDTVDPLLWGGAPVPFRPARSTELAHLPSHAAVAIWKARVPAAFLAEVEAGPWRILEVEDGFIRSAGLGADCVPPLSIVVDDLGVHYDQSRPNRLEEMLAADDLAEADLLRASKLREWIVRSGISKYGVADGIVLEREGGNRPHLLVVGQVEDDRSVRFGSPDVQSNLELLRRVRALNPDAWIIYRPHPDVEAGHRRGAIPQSEALSLADSIEPAQPISALIALVDEVHVMTSLAGFEALMHGKAVTVHGMPFFGGWGLTNDLVSVPPRRGRQLALDHLVATVLLRYPRYLDPVTNLPCTAEILVSRLLSGVQRQNVALVPLRRLAGWMKRLAAQISGKR